LCRSERQERIHVRKLQIDERGVVVIVSGARVSSIGGDRKRMRTKRTSNRPEYRAVSWEGSIDLMARHETPCESSS